MVRKLGITTQMVPKDITALPIRENQVEMISGAIFMLEDHGHRVKRRIAAVQDKQDRGEPLSNNDTSLPHFPLDDYFARVRTFIEEQRRYTVEKYSLTACLCGWLFQWVWLVGS